MEKKLIVVAAATLALGIGIGSLWPGNASIDAHADEAAQHAGHAEEGAAADDALIRRAGLESRPFWYTRAGT